MGRWYEFTEFGAGYFDTAPFRAVTKVKIDAPAEHVFRVLEDGDAWPRWIPAVARVEWTSPTPFDVGTTRSVYMRTGHRIDERFITWEDGREMAFTVLGSDVPGLTSFGERYVLTPIEGGCELRWTFVLQPRGFIAQGLYAIRPALRLALKRTLLDFKRVAEKTAR